MRRYTEGQHDTVVTIPRCAACARGLRGIRRMWLTLGVLYVVLLASSIVAIQVSSSDAVTKVLILVIFLTPFAMLPVGAVPQMRTGKRLGVTHFDRVSYPEARALKLAGWTTVRMPGRAYKGAKAVAAGLVHLQEWSEEAGRTTVVRKTCSSCHKVVPPASRAGERCPHCGAYWSTERWEGGVPH